MSKHSHDTLSQSTHVVMLQKYHTEHSVEVSAQANKSETPPVDLEYCVAEKAMPTIITHIC